MVKIKICGITNIGDALAAIRYGTDALGFIFAKSPRQISFKEAEKIIKRVAPFITKVGVFVNERPETVMEYAFKLHLDTLQFHGDEDDEYLKIFKPIKIIKAISIKNEESIKIMEKYKNTDAFLLDTYQKGKRGGGGKSFNWNLVGETKRFKKPIILSGGLTPDNVQKAIEIVKPYAVDVASGVEKSPGKKDRIKLKKFIQKVRETIL